MVDRRRQICGIALAIVLNGGPALADSASQPAPATDLSKQDGTLSDKLGASNGVIHPQESVDPAMEKRAPPTGATPVIPPAGSPGGATDAQPK